MDIDKQLANGISVMTKRFGEVKSKVQYHESSSSIKILLGELLLVVNEANTVLAVIVAAVSPNVTKTLRPRKVSSDTRKARGVWNRMRSKCYNEKHTQYYAFGAKGVKVCDRWNDFDNFYEDMQPFPANHSLNRWDWSKDFSKDNCYWSRSYAMKTILHELRRANPHRS